jgi:hypothetical protein
MKRVIVTLAGACLVPFGLLIPSELETREERLWAPVDIALAICYAAIIFVPLCVLGILLLFSNIKIK